MIQYNWGRVRPVASNSTAFTLIELLIVVSIIAILAAIAVPNFLAAQTRSKVARAKADMSTIATGLEAFAVDRNRYPAVGGILDPVYNVLYPLTTPISYLSTIPTEPWTRPVNTFLGKGTDQDPLGNSYFFQTANVDVGFGVTDPGALTRFSWSLASMGPDQVTIFPYYAFSDVFSANGSHLRFVYDATNGTISSGDIYLRGGASRKVIPGIPVK